MYSGQAAIDYLATEISKNDPGESSHWRKYHSAFKFTGSGFEGFQGFGGSQQPYSGPRLWIHLLLQRPFRRMGVTFPKFKLIDKLASDIIRKMRGYDLDVLRQVLTLSFLNKYAPNALQSQATVCVIGDGFASMTALLLASSSAGRVVLINLTKTMLVDLWYLKLWMGEKTFESNVVLVSDKAELVRVLVKEIPEGGQVIAIQAKDHELLRLCPVDIALNIASMQEMDPPVISAYFDDLRAIASNQQLIFYCCNREEKILPHGKITKLVNTHGVPMIRF